MTVLVTALVLIWLCATAVIARGGFRTARGAFLEPSGRRRYGQFLAGAALCATAFLANPVLNMLAFEPVVERLHSQMLADAKEAHCVGQSTEWLIARYGRPHEVSRAGSVEHWWYTPGPFFVVHEEYVGFTVEKGVVTSSYLQIN